MKPETVYTVVKRIKIHTSPLREVEVVKRGRFVRETSSSYIFDRFWVRKINVVKIKEEGEPDAR